MGNCEQIEEQPKHVKLGNCEQIQSQPKHVKLENTFVFPFSKAQTKVSLHWLTAEIVPYTANCLCLRTVRGTMNLKIIL